MAQRFKSSDRGGEIYEVSTSTLHGLKRGPLPGWVRVAILCAALEVVVVHIDGFDLYDERMR